MELDNNSAYLGNPLLKRANVAVEWTEETISEYQRCMEDPLYFVENYIKIVSLDEGVVPFKLFPFQKDIVGTIHNNRFTICKLPRQSGKTTTLVAYIVHYILFNSNINVAILANKAATARDILGRLQLAYENLPKWLQQGVMVWNKGSLELENGSRVVASATSSSAVRGGSYNCISSDSLITIKNVNTGKIEEISIANFSRRIEFDKYKQIHLKGEEHGNDREQIQEVLFFADGKGKKSAIKSIEKSSKNRETSYNSILSWRNRFRRKFSNFDSKRTFDSTSFIDKIFEFCGESKDVSCILLYDTGNSREICQTYRETTTNANERIFNSKKNYENRKETLRGNEKENFRIQPWKESFPRGKRKNIKSKFWKIGWNKKVRRILSESIKWIKGEKENQRAYGKNQQKSRKNKENSRSTSWHEAVRRIKTKNARSCFEENRTSRWSLEQRNEEDRWEVFTPNGFRKFHGLSKSISTNNIKLLFSDGSELKCTLDHRIATTIGFIEAKQLTESHSILSKDGIVHLINSIPSNDKLEVYDLLNVEKDNCFYANNILVHNCIVLDEFAFVPQNIAEDFFSSVYPTISSGKSTKVVVISTPNGMNLFYKLWSDAENQINSYVPIEVHWSEIPGRDEKWKKETIANTSAEQFSREFECNFLGSTNTLIHPTKIRSMAYHMPIKSNAGLDVYENPKPEGTYFLVADVARGTQNDYSAFIVFDVTTVPYKIAAKYRNNEIKPMLFPNVIHEVAKAYNKAYVMIEVNDIGDQVAHALQFDLEYDNMIMAAMRGRAGQILGGGFSGGKAQLGVKTTKAVKATGCSNIKQIIETDKIIIQDYDLINEWSTFILRGSSYEAEEGHTDDLAMCCVLFGWAVQQTYFKELTDDDIRARLFMEQQDQMEQDMAPFGFIIDGVTDYHNEVNVVDEYGTKWSPVVRSYETDW